MSGDFMDKIEEINKLLSDRPDLICNMVYERDIDFVKKIINMPEWIKEKFQGLLTSTIWQSNYDNIKNILSMEEWKEEKFQGLLTSTIW